MSQPRRRRRSRRRRGGGGSGSQKKNASLDQSQSKVVREQAPGATGRRSGRSRRRGRSGQVRSPASSEDLVRAAPKPPPNQLTAPHDGTTLDQVIADLQSDWGVPQHPQEYRITLKVAEERERAEGQTIVEERQDPETDQTPAEEAGDVRPKREKAPAAPRIVADGEEAATPKSSSRKRSRRRRRRPRKGPSGGSTTGPAAT